MHPHEQKTELEAGYEPRPIWVLSTNDLSQETTPARYRLKTPDGDEKEVVLQKRKRQVVDTLLKTDVFCASTVRLGDIVFRLKEDEELFADTLTLSNGRKYYSLNGKVERIGPIGVGEVAA